MREHQQKEQRVWLAVYDDDLRQDVLAGKIAHCVDTELPSEFCSWRLGEYEPFLINSNAVCVRKCDGLERLFEGQQVSAFVRLYLVKITQLFDVIRMKNYQTLLLSQLSSNILNFAASEKTIHDL